MTESTATDTGAPRDEAIALAEDRQQSADPYRINAEQMAAQVVEQVDGEVDSDYIAAYIRDRMWYRRGV